VSAASLVLDEPDAAARTLAVLAIFTVLAASGSFLGLVIEVRRTLR
jgi:hypothetical protein